MTPSFLKEKDLKKGEWISVRIPTDVQDKLNKVNRKASEMGFELDIEAMALDGIIKGINKRQGISLLKRELSELIHVAERNSQRGDNDFVFEEYNTLVLETVIANLYPILSCESKLVDFLDNIRRMLHRCNSKTKSISLGIVDPHRKGKHKEFYRANNHMLIDSAKKICFECKEAIHFVNRLLELNLRESYY